MLILMILEHTFPPDVRVEKEIKSLIEAGNEIVLACSSSASQDEVVIWKGATIIRKNMPRFIYKSSIGCLLFPFYFNYWRKYLRKVFKQNKFDAIHLHDLPLAKVAKEFSVRYHIPFILDLHENWPAMLKMAVHTNTFLGKILSSNLQWRKYERKYVSKADKIIVVVEEMEERIMKIGISKNKIVIVSNTFDSKSFLLSNKIPDPQFITLFYAGGINYHRGLQIVIKAMPKIIEKIPSVRLWIFGEGRYKKDLEELSKSHNLSDFITFWGWKNINEIADFLMQSDISLIPHLKYSHTDSTIPHKLFQYMYAGKPILSTNCVPLKRIIEETNTGMIYKFDSEDDFRKTLFSLLKKKNIWKQIVQNGRQAAMGKYNWKNDAKELLNIYQELR